MTVYGFINYKYIIYYVSFAQIDEGKKIITTNVLIVFLLNIERQNLSDM